MAVTQNAIRVQSVLSIQNGNNQYQNRPGSFQASMVGIRGPLPGTIVAKVGHTVIDLSGLDVPGGMCRLRNLDPDNFVTVGIYSAHFNEFFPFMDLLPGEEYVFRMSQFLGQDLKPGTGTGDQDAFINLLAAKADIASVPLQCDCFDG